ncbi:hypothetical protein LPJ53_004486 [Coemansia erecta]|uniref:RING-type E3 ubiquitin transferase n=1 Tax=Coemansia erecta TaxID=147472 RepID=A0A9W7XX24_9FUNG|nr:hypothetical protein LPJ53_004486 [Coemansia erecta]
MDDTLELAETGSENSSSSSEEEEEEAPYLCPICLQPVAERCYTDPCYHLYCFDCISQWTTQSSRCPLCNTSAQWLVHYDPHTKEPTRLPISSSLSRPYVAPRPSPYGRSPVLASTSSNLGLRKRHAVYAHNLHRIPALHTRRARISLTSSLFCREVRTARCRQWIRRDLQVLLGTEDVEFFEQIVLSAVLEVEEGEEMLQEVLGERTRRFVEELRAFVDSGLEIDVYDRFVAYDTRGGSGLEEETTSTVGEVVGERG